jgi:hypothetical protein
MKRVIAVLVALSMLAGCAQPLEEKSAGKDSDTQTHANRAPAQVSAGRSVPAPAVTGDEDRARIATEPRPEPAPREHDQRLYLKRHAEDGRRMEYSYIACGRQCRSRPLRLARRVPAPDRSGADAYHACAEGRRDCARALRRFPLSRALRSRRLEPESDACWMAECTGNDADDVAPARRQTRNECPLD